MKNNARILMNIEGKSYKVCRNLVCSCNDLTNINTVIANEINYASSQLFQKENRDVFCPVSLHEYI